MKYDFTDAEWLALDEWIDAALNNWEEARGLPEKEEQLEYWENLKGRLQIRDLNQLDIDKLYDYGEVFVEEETLDKIESGPHTTVYEKIKRLKSDPAPNPDLKRRLMR